MPRSIDDQWYRSERPHEGLASWAARLEREQGSRATQLLYDLRLYGDRELLGYAPSSYNKDRSGGLNRLSLNIIRSCVDAATSMAAENQPRAEWLTSAGDWTLQRKAKARTKFTDGLFYQGKVMRARRKALKTSILTGTGLVKVLRRHGRVVYEHAFPGNVLVDQQEAYHGDPRNMLEVRPYDREVLKALFPRAAKKIDAEESAEMSYFGRDPSADQVLVREAWHLPSAPDAKDGKHVIAITGETLRSEPWTIERFPFGIWRWSEEPLGFWGVGLGHQLMGIQLEINSLLETIQENIYRGGNLKVFVERAANIVQAHLSNTLSVPIIEYTGTPPTFAIHDVVSPQIMQHLQYLVGQAYAITGISEMHAQASTPSSITSGRQAAIYANMHSKRFLTFGQNDEEAMLDLAVLSLDCARQIHEDKKEGGLRVLMRNEENWLEEINAEDVIGDDDAFQPEVFSSSMLPRTPSGRMAMIEAWQQLGWVGPDQGKKLMGVKDFDAELALETAPVDLIDKRIEMILEEGKIIPPHPRMNLGLARERAMLAYQRAELNGTPPALLERLGEFLDLIDDVEAKLAPPAPPAGAPVPPEAAPPVPPAPNAPGAPPATLQ